MNTRQKICLLIGIIVAVGLLLYPPTDIILTMPIAIDEEIYIKPKSYTFHKPFSDVSIRGINWKVLCSEWLIIVLLDGTLIYVFRSKLKKRQGNSWHN